MIEGREDKLSWESISAWQAKKEARILYWSAEEKKDRRMLCCVPSTRFACMHLMITCNILDVNNELCSRNQETFL